MKKEIKKSIDIKQNQYPQVYYECMQIITTFDLSTSETNFKTNEITVTKYKDSLFTTTLNISLAANTYNLTNKTEFLQKAQYNLFIASIYLNMILTAGVISTGLAGHLTELTQKAMDSVSSWLNSTINKLSQEKLNNE